MRRFAGLIIALGFGVGVLSGHGLAQAKPAESTSDSSSGTSTTSSTNGSTNSPSGPQTPSENPTGDSPNTATDPTQPTDTDPTETEPADIEPTGSKDSPSLISPDPPRKKSAFDADIKTDLTRKSSITSSTTTNESTALSKVDDADLADQTTQPPSEPTPPPPTTIDDVSLATVSTEPMPQKLPAPTPAPAKPVEVIVGAVSSLVGGFLDPWATGGSPETPAGAPAAWSLLAFARREFETLLTPPTLAQESAAQTTTQTLAATDDLEAQTVENTLTYTPPPTIIDQLTLAGVKVIRDITSLIGIPFAALFGGLIATENPPFFLLGGLDARKTEFEVEPGVFWKVWEFEPPEPTGATVIAIHGGGFIFQPNLLHWFDYTQMARDTGATVLVPLYPVARDEDGTLPKVTPKMADYISHVIAEHGAENVSIYGDSAGYTYAFSAVRELILRGDEVPARMVLISGQADFSDENTIEDVDIDDPFFDHVTIAYFAALSGHAFEGVENKDQRFSPLRMETEVLQALPPTVLYVGTEEMTLPANLALYERAVEIGAPISMVVGRGQYHDWAISGLPVNSAAPKVRRDIYRQLGLLPETV